MKALKLIRDLLYYLFNFFFYLKSKKRIKLFGYHKIDSFVDLKSSKDGQIEIRENAIIKKYTQIYASGGKIVIGGNIFINRNVNIVSQASIVLGKNISIGPNVCIIDHDHNMVNNNDFIKKPIVIKDNVWIGANAIILKNVTIGYRAVIAAGAVVMVDVPDYTIYYSNSKMRKFLTEEERNISQKTLF